MHQARIFLVLSLAVLASIALSAPAAAHGDAACSGIGALEGHGQHVVGDYVTGTGGLSGALEWPPAGQVGAVVSANGGAAVPGGPGPGSHFSVPGLAPGASFCVAEAHPNGFTTPAAPAHGLDR